MSWSRKNGKFERRPGDGHGFLSQADVQQILARESNRVVHAMDGEHFTTGMGSSWMDSAKREARWVAV